MRLNGRKQRCLVALEYKGMKFCYRLHLYGQKLQQLKPLKKVSVQPETGLFPLNHAAILETAYAPSLNTDRQLHSEGSSEEIYQLAAISSKDPSSETTIAVHTSAVSAGTESNPVA